MPHGPNVCISGSRSEHRSSHRRRHIPGLDEWHISPQEWVCSMVLFLSYSAQSCVFFHFGVYAPCPLPRSSLNFFNDILKKHKYWNPHYIIFNIWPLWSTNILHNSLFSITLQTFSNMVRKKAKLAKCNQWLVLLIYFQRCCLLPSAKMKNYFYVGQNKI